MYEHDKREPSLGDLLAIARVCGVSPVELLADAMGVAIPTVDRRTASENAQRLLRSYEGLSIDMQLHVIGIVEALGGSEPPADKPPTRRGRPTKKLA